MLSLVLKSIAIQLSLGNLALQSNNRLLHLVLLSQVN